MQIKSVEIIDYDEPLEEKMSYEPPKSTKELDISKWMVKNLPALLGGTGSVLGSPFGPFGAIGGGVLGAGLGSGLQQFINPQQITEETGLEATPELRGGTILKDAALQGLFDVGAFPGAKLGAGMVTPTQPTLRTAIAKKFFMKRGIAPEAMEFIRENPDFPVTVSQVGKSPTAEILENVFARGRKADVIESQQSFMRGEFGKEISARAPDARAFTIAKNIQTDLESGLAFHTERVNKLYGNLRSIAAKNVSKRGIAGPIYFNKSSDFAQRFLDQLQTDYGVTSVPELLNVTNDAGLRKAVVTLRTIAGTRLKGSTIAKPTSLNAAIDVKSAVGEKGFRNLLAKKVTGEAAFRKLGQYLDEDIEASLGNFETQGQLAQETYGKAKKAAELKFNLFEETKAVENLVGQDFGHQQVINQIIKDPVAINKTMAAAGPAGPRVRKMLGAEVLADIFEQSYKDGVFKPNVAVDVFNQRSSEESIRRLFSAKERSALNKLFISIQHFDPNLPLQAVTAVGIRAAGTGLSFAAGALDFAVTGSLKSSVKTGGVVLGGLIGIRQFTKAILMNPQVARYAADAMRMPPQSIQARRLTQLILAGMEGGKIALTNQSGEEIGEAKIVKGGKIVPE